MNKKLEEKLKDLDYDTRLGVLAFIDEHFVEKEYVDAMMFDANNDGFNDGLNAKVKEASLEHQHDDACYTCGFSTEKYQLCSRWHDLRENKDLYTKEQVLELIGEDKNPSFESGEIIEVPTDKVASCVNTGYNQALKEMRNKLK